MLLPFTETEYEPALKKTLTLHATKDNALLVQIIQCQYYAKRNFTHFFNFYKLILRYKSLHKS